jgi:hypothetical protein
MQLRQQHDETKYNPDDLVMARQRYQQDADNAKIMLDCLTENRLPESLSILVLEYASSLIGNIVRYYPAPARVSARNCHPNSFSFSFFNMVFSALITIFFLSMQKQRPLLAGMS